MPENTFCVSSTMGSTVVKEEEKPNSNENNRKTNETNYEKEKHYSTAKDPEYEEQFCSKVRDDNDNYSLNGLFSISNSTSQSEDAFLPVHQTEKEHNVSSDVQQTVEEETIEDTEEQMEDMKEKAAYIEKRFYPEVIGTKSPLSRSQSMRLSNQRPTPTLIAQQRHYRTLEDVDQVSLMRQDMRDHSTEDTTQLCRKTTHSYVTKDNVDWEVDSSGKENIPIENTSRDIQVNNYMGERETIIYPKEKEMVGEELTWKVSEKEEKTEDSESLVSFGPSNSEKTVYPVISTTSSLTRSQSMRLPNRQKPVATKRQSKCKTVEEKEPRPSISQNQNLKVNFTVERNEHCRNSKMMPTSAGIEQGRTSAPGNTTKGLFSSTDSDKVTKYFDEETTDNFERTKSKTKYTPCDAQMRVMDSNKKMTYTERKDIHGKHLPWNVSAKDKESEVSKNITKQQSMAKTTLIQFKTIVEAEPAYYISKNGLNSETEGYGHLTGKQESQTESPSTKNIEESGPTKIASWSSKVATQAPYYVSNCIDLENESLECYIKSKNADRIVYPIVKTSDFSNSDLRSYCDFETKDKEAELSDYVVNMQYSVQRPSKQGNKVDYSETMNSKYDPKIGDLEIQNFTNGVKFCGSKENAKTINQEENNFVKKNDFANKWSCPDLSPSNERYSRHSVKTTDQEENSSRQIKYFVHKWPNSELSQSNERYSRDSIKTIDLEENSSRKKKDFVDKWPYSDLSQSKERYSRDSVKTTDLEENSSRQKKDFVHEWPNSELSQSNERYSRDSVKTSDLEENSSRKKKDFVDKWPNSELSQSNERYSRDSIKTIDLEENSSRKKDFVHEWPNSELSQSKERYSRDSVETIDLEENSSRQKKYFVHKWPNSDSSQSNERYSRYSVKTIDQRESYSVKKNDAAHERSCPSRERYSRDSVRTTDLEENSFPQKDFVNEWSYSELSQSKGRYSRSNVKTIDPEVKTSVKNKDSVKECLSSGISLNDSEVQWEYKREIMPNTVTKSTNPEKRFIKYDRRHNRSDNGLLKHCFDHSDSDSDGKQSNSIVKTKNWEGTLSYPNVKTTNSTERSPRHVENFEKGEIKASYPVYDVNDSKVRSTSFTVQEKTCSTPIQTYQMTIKKHFSNKRLEEQQPKISKSSPNQIYSVAKTKPTIKPRKTMQKTETKKKQLRKSDVCIKNPISKESAYSVKSGKSDFSTRSIVPSNERYNSLYSGPESKENTYFVYSARRLRGNTAYLAHCERSAIERANSEVTSREDDYLSYSKGETYSTYSDLEEPFRKAADTSVYCERSPMYLEVSTTQKAKLPYTAAKSNIYPAYPRHHDMDWSSYSEGRNSTYAGRDITTHHRSKQADVSNQQFYCEDQDSISIWRFGGTTAIRICSKTENIKETLKTIATQLRVDYSAMDLLYGNKIFPKSGRFSEHLFSDTKRFSLVVKETSRQAGRKYRTSAPDMIDPWEDEEPRVLMSCGHAITCENLFDYCLSQIQNGHVEITCPAVPDINKPQEQCSKVWNYSEVRDKASLSNDECSLFEILLSHNRIQQSKNIFQCPLCSKFIECTCCRSGLVVCKQCIRNDMDDFKFCKFCLQIWNNLEESVQCGNRECEKSLKKIRDILRSCSAKEIVGIQSCPTVRACPKCDVLVQHDGDNCKHMDCPSQSCRAKFCFVCLQVKTDKYYWPENCGGAFTPCRLAPKQSI